jgi:hypothetical protein
LAAIGRRHAARILAAREVAAVAALALILGLACARVVAQQSAPSPGSPVTPVAAPPSGTPATNASAAPAAVGEATGTTAKKSPIPPSIVHHSASGLDWKDLTAAERSALEPLAAEWEKFEVVRRKKWIEIADRFPEWTPEEQKRRQDRMRELAGLTPEQRRTARESFARAQALPPEKRAELFKQYQDLPEEKKAQLAAEAKATKSVVAIKPIVPHHTPVPSKAQIREGSEQRVPGLPPPQKPPASPAKPETDPASGAEPAVAGAAPQSGGPPGTPVPANPPAAAPAAPAPLAAPAAATNPP